MTGAADDDVEPVVRERFVNVKLADGYTLFVSWGQVLHCHSAGASRVFQCKT